MSTPRQRLSKARVGTFKWLPYLASYIYAMRVVETREIDTLAVDSEGRLYFNPDYLATLSIEAGAYAVAHEVLHLVFQHHKRGRTLLVNGGTEIQRFVLNVAADLVVEQTLAIAGMRGCRPDGAVALGEVVPQLGGLRLDFPTNLSMEDYYRRIMEQLNAPPPDGAGDDEDEDSDGSEDEDDEGDTAGSAGAGGSRNQPSGRAPPDSCGEGEGPALPGTAGGGGSCADGIARAYEVESDGSWEAYGQMQAATGAEEAIAKFEGNKQGTVPGRIKQAIRASLHPTPDPFAQLRAAVCTSVAAPIGGREFSRRRLSRKQPAADDSPLLHGRICTQPRAVVIVDTSGSMRGTDTHAQVLSVVAQGLRKLRRVKVVCADTHVRSHASIASTRAFEWVGGGGTDMAKAIEQVDRDDKPDSIVLITDAITDWPAQKPRARVVIAYTGDRDSTFHRAIPSWARTVVLKK